LGSLVSNAASAPVFAQASLDAKESEDDMALKQALIVADFKSAVDICLKLDRIADALVFGSCGGEVQCFRY
jgi:hypothetical protein